MVKSTLGYRRSSCRLCGSPKVDVAYVFPRVPLAEKYFDQPTEVPTFPVDLYWCFVCNHVQQLDVVYPEILWDGYIFNPMKPMQEHFREVSQRIKPEEKSLIVDIGSNDGSFLKCFEDCRLVGVDASKEISKKATDSGIETYGEMLSIPLAKKIVGKHGHANLVTAFNVFAHTDDLSEMLMSIKTLLSPRGKLVFEAQYLLDILEKNLYPTLFHEHLSHHSVTSLRPFFKRHGMTLTHVERNNIQHGSIIGTAQIIGEEDDSVKRLLELEKRITFDSVYEFGRKVLSKDLHSMECGYGASHSGPTIMALKGFEVDYIIDDHPQKVGKYAGKIPILPTSTLLERQPKDTFILAWVHQEKIIRENQEYLNRGGKFWTSI